MELQTTEGPFTPEPRWTVLFFYSGDFLPVTTTEMEQLATLQGDFFRCDAALFALSGDSLATHLAYLNHLSNRFLHKILFPLVALPHPCPKGIWILDPQGEPRAVFGYPDQTGVNFTEVLRTLAALQTEKPTPAGWVPGESPLLPPPQTREESILFMNEWERRGHVCVDWYLGYEKSEEGNLP